MIFTNVSINDKSDRNKIITKWFENKEYTTSQKETNR